MTTHLSIIAKLEELEAKATSGGWTFEPWKTPQGTRYQHIRSKGLGVADTYHADRIVSQAADLALGGDGDGFLEARHGLPEDAALICELRNNAKTLLALSRWAVSVKGSMEIIQGMGHMPECDGPRFGCSCPFDYAKDAVDSFPQI